MGLLIFRDVIIYQMTDCKYNLFRLSCGYFGDFPIFFFFLVISKNQFQYLDHDFFWQEKLNSKFVTSSYAFLRRGKKIWYKNSYKKVIVSSQLNK